MAARVLVIDDDPGTCETIGDILQARGLEVRTATRGRAGLAHLAAVPTDVAIVDVRLPDVPGLEVLQAARALQPDIESIVITGYASMDTAMQAINDSAFAYFIKPLDMNQLVAALDRALDRQRLIRALRESEQRYRLLIDSIGDPVFLLDLDERIVFANRRAADVTGYPDRELLGRPVFTLLAPEGAREVTARLLTAEAGPGVTSVPDIRLVGKDERTLCVDATVTSVLKEGRLVGRLAVLHDVTEKKRLEDQLRQSQKMEAVGRLAGGVAHDFNNLLAIIMGYGDLVRSALGKDRRLAREVEEIRRASERGVALTRQLFAFSRGQLARPQVVDLNALVRNTASLLRRLMGREVDLRVKLAPRAGRISADPGQIEQVVTNLALNARDAMPDGGRLTLETASVDLTPGGLAGGAGGIPDPHVRLTVRDTGCGMSPEVRARLFEPFFTTKEPGRGTGLGLSTVEGIVRQHRGRLEVDSEPGRGSAFHVYLPRVSARPAVASPRRSEGVRPRGTETVLVVEHEPALRELMGRILARSGYTVLPATDGAGALSLLQRHRGAIDLVLTNIVMPRVGGLELAAHLSATHPRARVLYISGYSADSLRPPSDVGDRAVVLEKPFTPDALLRKVREVLDARRRRRTPRRPPRNPPRSGVMSRPRRRGRGRRP
jgi:PAS domain S-box-containing protein